MCRIFLEFFITLHNCAMNSLSIITFSIFCWETTAKLPIFAFFLTANISGYSSTLARIRKIAPLFWKQNWKSLASKYKMVLNLLLYHPWFGSYERLSEVFTLLFSLLHFAHFFCNKVYKGRISSSETFGDWTFCEYLVSFDSFDYVWNLGQYWK